MVKDGGALARATSIGPRAATGLEVSACGWWHSSLRHHAARRQ